MKFSSLAGKNLLLVNTGSYKKRFILKKLSKLDINVTCLNKEENWWSHAYVHQWILADTANHSEALQAIDNFLKTNLKVKKFDGVVTFWEDDVLLTSKIVDRYNLTGIPYRIASQVRNKFKFREFCEKNGLPFPKHKMLKNEEDIKAALKEIKLPVVLKPAYGSSSAFVIKAENEEDVYKSYAYIKSNISDKVESALTEGRDVFVEEYLDGDEVDVDVLLQNGKVKFITVSDNFDKSKGTFFIDSGQALPSSLPDVAQEEMIEMVELVLEKLGIFNACIHFEAKYTKNGPVPIEINMRMGGDYVYSYIKTSWNIDFIEYATKIALGDYFVSQQKDYPKKYTIGWDLHPEDSGILTELDISEDLEKQPYFEAMDIYKEVGDSVLVPPEGYESLGWVTVSGDNPLDARDNLKKVLEQINFKVVPYDTDSFLGKTLRKDKFSVATLNKQILLKEAKFAKIQRISKEDLRKLRIGVVGNLNGHSNNPVDSEFARSAKDVCDTLQAEGYDVKLFNVSDISTTLNELKSSEIDFIYNLARKVDNITVNEARVSAFLDSLSVAYTGSDTYPLTITSDKITFKKLLKFHDIPTPCWDYLFDEYGEIDEDLEYPLIVKPASKDNSIGISNESVVVNKAELECQVTKIMKELKSPVLLEEYIDGDEYSVMILGNEDDDIKILPLSRTNFDKFPKDRWHIYSYDLKWNKEKDLSKKLLIQNPPSKIPKKLEKLITEIALDTYSITRCRDYGQVEVKVDRDGNPYVLELNANPSLALGSEIVKSARTLKLGHIGLLEEIMLTAIKRYKLKSII
jgi:D-alanine-D-alanine ligase